MYSGGGPPPSPDDCVADILSELPGRWCERWCRCRCRCRRGEDAEDGAWQHGRAPGDTGRVRWRETGAGRRVRGGAERLVDNGGVFRRSRVPDLEAWSLGGKARPSACRPNYDESSRPSGTRDRGRGLLPAIISEQRGGWAKTGTRASNKCGAACDSRCINLGIGRGSDVGGMGNKKNVMGSGGLLPGASALHALSQKLRALHRGGDHAEEGERVQPVQTRDTTRGLRGLTGPVHGSIRRFPPFHPNLAVFLRERGNFHVVATDARPLSVLGSVCIARPPAIASDRCKMAVFTTSQQCNGTQITARQGSHHREAHGGTRRAASLVEHGLLGVEVERHHARNGTGTNSPPTRSTRARRPRLDLSRPWPALELLTPSRFPDCRVMKKRQFDDIGSPNRAQLLGTSSARPVSTGVCSDDAMFSGSWTSDN